MWTWRTDDPTAIGRNPWGDGIQRWRDLERGGRAAIAGALLVVAFVLVSFGAWFGAAAVALERGSGVVGGTEVGRQSSWLPPGTRYTVLIDGGSEQVVQPWSTSPSWAVATWVGASIACATLLWAALIVILGFTASAGPDWSERD